MANRSFTSEELSSTVQRFTAICNEVSQLDLGTWGESLKKLMEFCEIDPLMQMITEPLVTAEVGINYLLSDGVRPHHLTKLPLPDAPIERLAFIYQLLLRIGARLLAITHSRLASQDVFESLINGMHDKFVVVFMEEMQQRLTEIERRNQGKTLLTVADLIL